MRDFAIKIRNSWLSASIMALVLVSAGCDGGSPIGDVPLDAMSDATDAKVNVDIGLPGDTIEDRDGEDLETGEVSDDTILDALADTAELDGTADTCGPDCTVTPECPGAAGCACEGAGDCYSGICVEGPNGKECAKMCGPDIDCPEGWNCVIVATSGQDQTWGCIYTMAELCRPCKTNADCIPQFNPGDSAYKCIEHDINGSYCGAPCEFNTDCPEGFSCSPVGEDPDVVTQCVPDDGECWCSDRFINQGFLTECRIENEFGSCVGERTCDVECDGQTPSAETCNNLDDNCNGQTDDLETLECQLTNEHGTCPGTLFCASGHETCQGTYAEAETCNNKDDDCDGTTDEDLGVVTCGKGQCEHEQSNCVDGQTQFCNPFEGATEEVCDLIDNDCDGSTDEGFGSTTCGKGQCEHTVVNCLDGVTQTCNPLEGSVTETCDDLDNDCDGSTDEGLGTTSCGVGVCLHSVPNCVEGVVPTCNPLEGQSIETCNGKDDDCDGTTDEGLGTTTCGLGACNHTIDNCLEGATKVCDPYAGSTTENCNGSDDDCDGSTDEGLGSTTCGVGVCLHTIDNCSGGVAQTCDPLAGMDTEVCNNKDDDCDGSTDEEIGSTECGLGECTHTEPNCINGVPNTCDPFDGQSDETCNNKDDDCDGTTDNDIEGAADGYEPNDACASAWSLGTVVEGGAESGHTANLYPMNDIDWYKVLAKEDSSFCWPGAEETLTFNVRLVPPTGVNCADYEIAIYDSNCAFVAQSPKTGCTAEEVSFSWTGVCTQDDNREFHVRVIPKSETWECSNYQIFVGMD